MKGVAKWLVVPLAIGLALAAAKENEVAHPWEVAAEAGTFSIHQHYEGNFAEIIRFRDPKKPEVRLAGFEWPGTYSISPDQRWILRTQKTGSGDNMATLYRVEKTGRVSEVIGFNSLLWAASDREGRLKFEDLYHSGVENPTWSKDAKHLEMVLRGSNAEQSGDGLIMSVTYELESHVVTTRPAEPAKPGR